VFGVPKEIFLTRGVGRHKEKLTSFEMALRDASIAEYNLVRVSSIFPPQCKMIPKTNGLKKLNAGQVIPCVISENQTNEPRRIIAASIGVAIPANREKYGYLSEHHSFGEKEKTAGDYAEDLAAEMLATILGVEFDPNKSWDEKREQWKISGQIVKTRNITQTALGSKDGVWTTVISAAVLIL
jgi:arginine decarboxylase